MECNNLSCKKGNDDINISMDSCQNIRRKIRIGIDAEEFKCWSGGVDFISTLAYAMEDTGRFETFLLIAQDVRWLSVLKKVYRRIILGGSKFKKLNIDKEDKNNNEVIEIFRIISPKTSIVKYNRLAVRSRSNGERMIRKIVEKNSIKVLFPRMKCDAEKQHVPQIGHIPDCQHKYFPELFSKEECLARDSQFEWQLQNSDSIIVYSENTKKDIRLFYPDYKTDIFVLPYGPLRETIINEEIDLSKYNLPERYFVICNQFWEHKDHYVVFLALEKLYENGIRDIHIVCTGKMEDSRNSKFIDILLSKVEKLTCCKNIHFLGYIPKEDQVLIMSKSMGLIQPTLFEGTPGGMSSLTALSIGLPLFLSDISVNKEIMAKCSNIYFFTNHDDESLFNILNQYLKEKKNVFVNNEEIIENTRKEYSDFLIMLIMNTIKKYDGV